MFVFGCKCDEWLLFYRRKLLANNGLLLSTANKISAIQWVNLINLLFFILKTIFPQKVFHQ